MAKKVLVVDDEKLIVKGIRFSLEQDDMEVDCAYDGEEALEMVKDAIATKEVAGYLGWDIAISENGPMLLEVNNRPGADGLSTAYAQEGIGMKHVMDKYL